MNRTRLFVGIAGGTGSGKTTLARELVRELQGGVSLLEYDWYYRDRSDLSPSEREGINYDEPRALEGELLRAHLDTLRGGAPIDAPIYDFSTHTRSTTTKRIEPAPVVAVEGMLLFAEPLLEPCFDLRIFVDTDDDIRLLRRIQRDMAERGRDLSAIAAQYEKTVRPMHLMHVAPSRRRAHLIVPEGGENWEALEVIVARLKMLIE